MHHPERRRFTRTNTSTEHRVAVDLMMTARLLDVSVGGVLLASETELVVGDRRDLHISIGEETVDVPIEVRHASTDSRSESHKHVAGAVILPTTLPQRERLEKWFGRR